MFSEALYEPTQISQLFKPNKSIPIQLTKLQPAISQRTLIVSIIHMLLGLPSQLFPIKNNKFEANHNLLQLSHITHQLIQNQTSFFVNLGSQLQELRLYIKEVISCPQSIIQAFGVGLHKIASQIEIYLSQKLKTVQHQEEYHAFKLKPTTLLSFSTDLIKQNQRLLRLKSLIEFLPELKYLNNEDSQNIGTFILNVYYNQCDKEYLTGVAFPFHSVFAQCLKVYLQTCKNWIAVNQKQLLSSKNTCFFIDLNLSLSKDKQKMFQTKKIILKQKVPKLLMSNYRKLFQLGKTVHFIKLYLKEEQLYRFIDFFSIQQEFRELDLFLTDYLNVNACYFPKFTYSKTKNSISSRIGKQKNPVIPKTQSLQNNFFGQKEQSSIFFYLRSNSNTSTIKNPRISNKNNSFSNKIDSQIQNFNQRVLFLLDSAINRLTLKCKVILRQKKIRQSIDQTLKGIKKFVLLQQGDFVQQFLELSQTILEKPTQKILPTHIERLIEEAIKNSALNKQAENFKQSVFFVFLRNQQGSMKGWRTFSFAFQSGTPANCIFTSQSMQSYQYIGNLLFNMRRCQQILVSYWSHPFFNAINQLLQARNAVHRFVCALQSYIFAEIQQNWSILLQKFESCDNVLGLIQANQQTLQKLRQITIQNKALCNSMLSLIKIIQRFQLMRKQHEEGRQQSFKADLQQIWSWFLSLLDQSKQIRNFADSFDFKLNYY